MLSTYSDSVLWLKRRTGARLLLLPELVLLLVLCLKLVVVVSLIIVTIELPAVILVVTRCR